MKTLILIALLVCSSAYAQKKQNVSTGDGRFQLIQLSDFRRDQFLVDTHTGKLWTRICSVTDGDNCEMSSWSQEYVIGVNISEDEYYKKVKSLKEFIKEQKKAGN